MAPTAGRSTVELAVEEAVVTGVVPPDRAAGPLAGELPLNTSHICDHPWHWLVMTWHFDVPKGSAPAHRAHVVADAGV